ncbi:MAG TPA: hypothetical protein VFI42_02180 [Thermomicrobiaceae bacterium]|nr:hypothetical protein [Thermomicrobiaceae bacterium]
MAYADIFDYPLTLPEIHRYLIGLAVSRDSVRTGIEHELVPAGRLVVRDGYYALPGREAAVAARLERRERAARVWPRALRYGRLIASLPFVRLVAVTGELAMDNVRPESDIDFFVVTEHRRLWLCRALILGVVHAAARLGDTICPNYLLSERALALDDGDLYSAHEIAQMIPLAGLETYARFRQLNPWVFDYLPNAAAMPRDLRARPTARPARALAESALRTPAGTALERWESGRKLRRFRAEARGHAEASFTLDWCKGHVHDHGQLILEAFARRTPALAGDDGQGWREP